MNVENDFPMLGKNITYLDNCATTFKPYGVIKEINNYYENYRNRRSRIYRWKFRTFNG